MQRRTLVKMLGLAGLSPAAFAQSGSSKTIRIVVPLSSGTPSDAVARMIAPKLSVLLGQPVIVENKPGANGIIAIQDVMKSPPDGTTLLMGSVSFLAINSALVKDLPYDPQRDLSAVAGVYSNNHVWCVHPSIPVKSVAELIAYAKARPGRVSTGVGSSLVQIQLAAFEKQAGVAFLQVPYKSTATNITDLIGGTLDISLIDMGTAMSLSKDGRVRVLGTSPLKRNILTPEWPAISETLPGYDMASWTALVGPAGIKPEVLGRLSEALMQIIQQKDFTETLSKTGSVPMAMTPAQLQAHIGSEVRKFTSIAREAKIEPQ